MTIPITDVPTTSAEIREIEAPNLPLTDRLYSIGTGGLLLRVRVARIVDSTTPPPEGSTSATAQFIQPAQVVYEVQIAPACNETGDVLKDAAGNNILFAAERHSVASDGMSSAFSMRTWAAETLFRSIQEAVRKSKLLADAHFDDPFAGTAPTPEPHASTPTEGAVP